MTTQVFEFFRGGGAVPITVFAHDLAEAEDIFSRYLDAHEPGQHRVPPMIYPYGAEWLSKRPLLEAAAQEGNSGIGYYLEWQWRWEITEPEASRDEPLAPPERSVHYYRFESEEGDDAMLFATSYEQAVTFYCVWHQENWGSLPPHFTARQMDRWMLTGPLAVLRDQLEAEIPGVAQWNMADGWTILPPDWEPPLGR